MGNCVSTAEQDPILGVRLRQSCIDGDIDECDRVLKQVARGPGGLLDEAEPDSSMAEHAFFFDTKGQTALHLASTYGNVACVKLLLDRGASTIIDQYGRLPCHLAAENGHLECLRLLLSRREKADPNVRERVCGRTMLHLSAYAGHTEQIRLLLAQQSIKVNKQEMTGSTALHYASHEGHHDVVSELLAHADTDVGLTEYVYGHTVLHKACIGGYARCCQLLLERPEVDVNQGDEEFGRSAVHWAAQNASPGALECLEMLLGVGLKDGAKSTKGGSGGGGSGNGSGNGSGSCGLGRASSAESVASFNPSVVSTPTTPTHSTCEEKGDTAAVQPPLPPPLLSSASLAPSLPTFASSASSNSSSAAVASAPLFLREAERRVCDVDKEDFFGRTPLLYAAQAGHTAALRLLVDRGASVNHQDKEGMTALLLAACNNRHETLRALLEHPDVDRSIENLQGESIFTIANTDPQARALVRTYRGYL